MCGRDLYPIESPAYNHIAADFWVSSADRAMEGVSDSFSPACRRLSRMPLPVRVPTVKTNQVLALIGNVLRDLGQKVQGVEDLEISLRSAAQIGAGRTGKAVATAWLSSRPQVRPQGPPHPRGQLFRVGQVVDRQGGHGNPAPDVTLARNLASAAPGD